MAKNVTVNFPNRPKGSPMEVPGYGLFKNGETKTFENMSGDDLHIPAVEAGPLPDNLEQMNKSQLQQLAAQHGVEDYDKLNKDDLVNALNTGEES